MLFECMGVLSPAHEISEMRGFLVYLISLILFKFSHSTLDWTALSWNFSGDLKKKNMFRGVCGPCHL